MTAITSKADSQFRVSRREALLGGILVGTAVLGGALELRETVVPPAEFDIGEGLPEQIAGRVSMQSDGIVRPAEEADVKSIYDQEVSRLYLAASGPAIMLMVAYGSTQSENLQLHRPEICYPASGFNIGETQRSPQPVGGERVIPANFFTAVRGDRVEHVLYWTRLGDEFPSSWVDQHVARMSNSIRGIVPDGVLVRASVIGTDPLEARGTLRAFLEKLVVDSTPQVGKILAG